MTLLSFSLLGSPHWVRYLRAGGAGTGRGTCTGYTKHYATLQSSGKFSAEKWDSGRTEVGERGDTCTRPRELVHASLPRKVEREHMRGGPYLFN
jgi:hypothetical protein